MLHFLCIATYPQQLLRKKPLYSNSLILCSKPMGEKALEVN